MVWVVGGGREEESEERALFPSGGGCKVECRLDHLQVTGRICSKVPTGGGATAAQLVNARVVDALAQ